MDKVAASFRRFDLNGDGLISSQELREVLTCLDQSWSEARLNCLFKVLDINSDGFVDYEEFMDWMFNMVETRDLQAFRAATRNRKRIPRKLAELQLREGALAASAPELPTSPVATTESSKSNKIDADDNHNRSETTITPTEVAHNEMSISVVGLDGQSQQYFVNGNDTVGHVKKLAAADLQCEISALSLMSGAVPLDHRLTLLESGIGDGSSLNAVRIPPAPDGFDDMSDEERGALLYNAAKSGDVDLTSLLILHGAPLNSFPRGALWEAVNRGDESVALALIDGRANVNQARDLTPKYKHCTRGDPILVAARRGHPTIIRALLAANADVESYGSWNQDIKAGRGTFRGPCGRPLGIAALSGHASAVSALLEARADMEQCCIFQCDSPSWEEIAASVSGIGTALFAAAAVGHVDVMEVLAKARADPNSLGVCISGNPDSENRIWYAYANHFDSRLNFTNPAAPVGMNAMEIHAYLQEMIQRGYRESLADKGETPSAVAMRFDRTAIKSLLSIP